MLVGMSYKQSDLLSLPEINSVMDKKFTAWTALEVKNTRKRTTLNEVGLDEALSLSPRQIA